MFTITGREVNSMTASDSELGGVDGEVDEAYNLKLKKLRHFRRSVVAIACADSRLWCRSRISGRSWELKS